MGKGRTRIALPISGYMQNAYQVTFLCEGPDAVCAGIRLLTGVRSAVILQRAECRETLRAKVAHVRPLARVDPFVFHLRTEMKLFLHTHQPNVSIHKYMPSYLLDSYALYQRWYVNVGFEPGKAVLTTPRL